MGYAYEADSDLSSLTHSLNAISLTLGYTHNNSHQIKTINASDSFYLPQPSAASSTAYVPKALNEYASVGGQISGYDLNGNLLTWYPPSGQSTYTYVGNDPLDKTDAKGLESACVVANNCPNVQAPKVSEATAKTIVVSTLGAGAVGCWRRC